MIILIFLFLHDHCQDEAPLSIHTHTHTHTHTHYLFTVDTLLFKRSADGLLAPVEDATTRFQLLAERIAAMRKSSEEMKEESDAIEKRIEEVREDR